ncbi:hypothetical protein Sjap_002562 [Stephania japonica]|uniref:Cytochrome P450 n=1 Tax=Stephania japonica TaxID=461633 RepID=A0AAP0KM36_9MAGN
MAKLLKSPDTMKKVQAEVRKIIGKKMKVKEEDIQQMEYLKCVIKEALRLHPPVPLLIPRESVTSTQIKEYTIPAKTRVYINVWAIQRDPMLWDKADEFIPKRFIGSTIDFTGQDFELVPIGLGRRSCPGVLFGIAVVELALANLLEGFRLSREKESRGRVEVLALVESMGQSSPKSTVPSRDQIDPGLSKPWAQCMPLFTLVREQMLPHHLRAFCLRVPPALSGNGGPPTGWPGAVVVREGW